MGIEVVIADEDDASGMATMLGGLLGDNLRDFPSRARVARMLRGPVVLTASDRGVSVTLEFRSGRVEVRDGSEPGAPEVAGPWLMMTKLCSGLMSPIAAVRSGEVGLHHVARAPLAAGAGFVLSVPPSFYEADDPAAQQARRRRRRVRVAVVVGVVAVVGVLMMRSRRS